MCDCMVTLAWTILASPPHCLSYLPSYMAIFGNAMTVSKIEILLFEQQFAQQCTGLQ